MQQVSVAFAPHMASVPESPRRERKKRQTRDALVHAALKRFDAKGYEHTAVREITDAVDVSASKQWRAQGCGSAEEMDACLDQVGPAPAGHWTAR
jgi:hypothetical protein